jgi:membrane glycosyltransferase
MADTERMDADGAISETGASGRSGITPIAGFHRTPAEARLDMPMQPLNCARTKPPKESDGRWRLALIVAIGVLLTSWATREMIGGFAQDGINPLEWTAIVLFTINFFWLTTAAATAAAGCMVLMRTKKTGLTDAKSKSLTAIVIPLYNERAAKVMGAAEAMWEALKDRGAERSFEIFFLSDTSDPVMIDAEEAAMQDVLRRRPNEPFFYRRRRHNWMKKQGNIGDFVQRWGGRYEYMAVLDADSLMTPDGIVELVRRMDASPRTALIQTLPMIVSARTFSARGQQFGLRAHGGLFGAGLSWWSGGAGNFWGHNAIIRVKPFASHAKLPDLPGKAPLGGPILSHDFVEAALLRRAGWRVEIAHDIEGSYEETPPTLVDVAQRDRRWAQGNIQQIQIMRAKGFDFINKAHIMAGLAGYLSGALWLSFIIVGVAIALQAKIFPAAIDDGATLSPVADDQWRALRLLALTAFVLLSPKWLAVLAWANGKLPGWSKHPRFLVQIVVDAGLTALVAPIMMVNHTGSIIATITGKDAGWRPQERDRDMFSWADLVRIYRPHMIVGFGLLFSTAIIGWHFVLLQAPLTLTLIFAPVLVALLSGRARRDSMMWKLFATPEDDSTPEIVREAERMSLRLPGAKTKPRPVGVRATRLARLSVAMRRAVRKIRKDELAVVRARARNRRG